ncbi:unnamed protein product [Arctogadus glacialis]
MAPCNSRGNLGFQLYSEAAKPGGDTIQPDALNHHTLGEEHFLVDTKDPQPAKDVSVDIRAEAERTAARLWQHVLVDVGRVEDKARRRGKVTPASAASTSLPLRGRLLLPRRGLLMSRRAWVPRFAPELAFRISAEV